MKRALIVTSTPGFVTLFEKNNIKILKSLGYIVDVATNYSIANQNHIDYYESEFNQIINIPFVRSPFSLKTYMNLRTLKKVFNSNKYDIIHCHTPVASILTRLAARKSRKNGSKVFYTAHGFHFFKGAPLVNWLIYYPIEKFCSKYTDVLLTINDEDYCRASKKFKMKSIFKIPGVGIDVEKFKKTNINKTGKREELGLDDDSFVMLSIGELNKNKNHEVVIKALDIIKNPKIQYVICGVGPLEQYLQELIDKYKLTNNVKLLGFRTDIDEICNISNLFVFPSLREGLPVSIMEAMASGLPCIASNIRGCNELIVDNEGGFLVNNRDSIEFSNKIKLIFKDENLSNEFSKYNMNYIDGYSNNIVNEKMEKIYSSE